MEWRAELERKEWMEGEGGLEVGRRQPNCVWMKRRRQACEAAGERKKMCEWEERPSDGLKWSALGGMVVLDVAVKIDGACSV